MAGYKLKQDNTSKPLLKNKTQKVTKGKHTSKKNTASVTSATSLSSAKSHAKAKANKSKLGRLNADINGFDEIRGLVVQEPMTKITKDKLKALDSIKDDYIKDEEKKKITKLANEEIEKQLEVLTGIGL